MKFSRSLLWLSCGAALALFTFNAQHAQATLINPLAQFDLVVLTNMTGDADVEGGAYIGGNLSGNASTFDSQNQTPLPTVLGYNNVGLTVGGNISSTESVNNGGNLVYGGTGAGNVNMNGGGSRISVSSSDLSSLTTTINNELGQLSEYFAGLPANSTAALNNNTLTFTVSPSAAGGIAVFDISASDFESANTGFELNNSAGADFILVNVAADNNNSDVFNSSESFSGGFSAADTLWNFSESNMISIQISIQNQFLGSILAPDAMLYNTTQIDGAVGVDEFTQNGEIHLPLSPDIPTPEAPTFGMLALCGAFLLTKRGQKN